MNEAPGVAKTLQQTDSLSSAEHCSAELAFEDDQCTCVCKTMEPLAMTGKSSPSLTAVYKLSLLVSSLVL